MKLKLREPILNTFFFRVCLLIFLSLSLTTTVYAKSLKVAVGLSIPPYVIKEKSRGIEFDILKEVLASQGYEMEPVYVPLARTLFLLKNGAVDGIMSTGQKDLPGCYTDSHITYWNFAISLASNNFKIQSIADLQNKRIISFQNAKNYLGKEFHQMAITNKKYREVADQSIQNKLLFLGRADVVIADRYIFEWFARDPKVKMFNRQGQKLTHHALFEPSHFRAVFKSEAICKAFNTGLKLMRQSGRYKEIIASYDLHDPEIVN